MAKKTSKKVQLSEADELIYNAMPPSEQALVKTITNPVAQSAYIQNWAASRTQSTGGLPGFTPVISTTPAEEQTYFERALGTEVGRRIDPMGQPVAGTATRIGAAVPTIEQEVRGQIPTGYTPRYYESDADLINTFGYEKIAEIQNRLVKAGYLGNKYALGRVDAQTRKAWVELLEDANRTPSPSGQTSVDWNTALNISVKDPARGSGKLPPKVSNPADILKVARQVSRNVLGREDQTILNEVVQAFQRLQVREQTGQLRMQDGMRIDTPGLEAFAEKKIQQAAGPEAEAYKFAQFADRLFGMAGSGEGIQRDVELEMTGG